MTAATADRETRIKEGRLVAYPVAASTTIYKGTMVCVNTSGYAVAGAATGGYRFVGVADAKANNSAGTDGAINVLVDKTSVFEIIMTSITQAMVGDMMYLTDDQTADETPATVPIPIGKLVKYVSATSGWVDPTPVTQGEVQGPLDMIEVIAADRTLTVEESGMTFLVATDALTITLPSTKLGVTYTFVNSGADGNNIITISPAAADGIHGTIANAAADAVSGGVDNKDWINTKATANKGDWCKLVGDGSVGWYIQGGVGIWASEG